MKSQAKQVIRGYFTGCWQNFYEPLIQSELKPVGSAGELGARAEKA